MQVVEAPRSTNCIGLRVANEVRGKVRQHRTEHPQVQGQQGQQGVERLKSAFGHGGMHARSLPNVGFYST